MLDIPRLLLERVLPATPSHSSRHYIHRGWTSLENCGYQYGSSHWPCSMFRRGCLIPSIPGSAEITGAPAIPGPASIARACTVTAEIGPITTVYLHRVGLTFGGY
jgi:hypothetical protein